MRPAPDVPCGHTESLLLRQASRAGAPIEDLQCLVGHLYECRQLSTYEIGELTGLDRQRVGRLLHRAGIAVKPRGEGRPRRRDARRLALDSLLRALYLESGLSSAQVAAVTGIPDRTVRGRLRSAGVPMRTRGQLNREDRVIVPPQAVLRLYIGDGMSAAEAGRVLGVSGNLVLRTAHDEGLPVRAGGAGVPSGAAEIELIAALYADVLVRRTLSRHGIAHRPAGGPIWHRFPVPVPLTVELVRELYCDCGVGVRHVELLTGQPAQTILRMLRANAVPLRPAGGRTPFMRRWHGKSSMPRLRDAR